MMQVSVPRILACRLTAFALLAASSWICQAQDNTCSYGRDVYSHDSYLVKGATCQACFVGHWNFRDTRTPNLDVRCLGSNMPSGRVASSSSPLNACGTGDGGIFSHGAVRLDANRCWRCTRSEWTEVDAIQWCNVARRIDEQRAAP